MLLLTKDLDSQTIIFLKLPHNQPNERDPGYRDVAQPSCNKPAKIWISNLKIS
jgi:hypothetical protein